MYRVLSLCVRKIQSRKDETTSTYHGHFKFIFLSDYMLRSSFRQFNQYTINQNTGILMCLNCLQSTTQKTWLFSMTFPLVYFINGVVFSTWLIVVVRLHIWSIGILTPVTDQSNVGFPSHHELRTFDEARHRLSCLANTMVFSKYLIFASGNYADKNVFSSHVYNSIF